MTTATKTHSANLSTLARADLSTLARANLSTLARTALSTLARTALLLALLSACGSDAMAPPDGTDPGPDPAVLTPRGSFTLHSDYDLAANLPGEAGKVLTVFIDATDGADDPTRYLVDRVVDALPAGHLKNLARSSAPILASLLNERILTIAPTFVSTVRDAGNKLGQIAHHFGLREQLDATADGHAVHTVTGLHLTLDRAPFDLPFAEVGQPTITTPTTVSLDDTGTLAIADHTIALSYGQLVTLALDKAIIPMLDASAVDLADLFAHLVDCHAVGDAVYEALELGSAQTFESACADGLVAGADLIYASIDAVDTAALELTITDAAKGIDVDDDGDLDRIVTGSWTGTASYAGSPVQLPTATFYGERR